MSLEWISLLIGAPGVASFVLIVLTHRRVRKMSEQIAEMYADLEGKNHV